MINSSEDLNSASNSMQDSMDVASRQQFVGNISPAGGSPTEGSNSLLHSVRRRWLIGAFFGVLCAAGAGYYAWTSHLARYSSYAEIRITNTQPILGTKLGSSSQESLESFKSLQRHHLLSRDVINRALSDREVAKLPEVSDQVDPVSWLRGELSVKIVGGTDYIVVSLRGENPKSLKLIIDAVIKEYLIEVALDETKYTDATRNRLKELHREAESEYLESVRNWKAADKLTEEQKVTVQRLEGIREEVDRLRLSQIQAEGELKFLQLRVSDNENPTTGDLGEGEDSARIPASDADIDVAMQQDELSLDAEKRKSELLAKIQRNKELFNEVEARRRNDEINDGLDSIEKFLQVRREVLREFLGQGPGNPASESGLRERVFELKSKIELMTFQRRQLEPELESLFLEVEKFTPDSPDRVVERVREDSIRRIFSELSNEYSRILREDASGPKVEIAGMAFMPMAPDNQKDLQKAAMLAIAGFALPIALVVWIDLRKKHVNSPDDVGLQCGIELLGVVPKLPRRHIANSSPSKRQKIWQQKFSEAIDSVSAILMKSSQKSGTHSLLVSSAMAGEGKTTLATHLAMSLAASGQRTIIVDFDLRRPTLNEVFGVAVSPGVSEVLCTGLKWEDAVHREVVPNLTLLTAGNWTGNSLGSLSASQLKTLMNDFRQKYDFAIIDGSPLLPVVDGRLVGQHVDGVILSLLRDVSQSPRVLSAASVLESYEIPLLGAVLTGTSGEAYYREKRTPVSASA